MPRAHHRTLLLLGGLAASLCALMLSAAAATADGTPGAIFGEVTAGLTSDPGATQPVAGVVVTTTDPSGATTTATTDANGSYEINNLMPNTYTVSFAPPSGYLPKTSPGVQVPAGGTTEADAILVELPAGVTGVITDPNGRPLPGMEMEAIPTALPCPSGAICGPQSASGTGGRYTVGGLTAGAYDMQVVDAGKSIEEGTVTLAAGATATVNVHLGPPQVSKQVKTRNARRDLNWLNAERARLGLPGGLVLNTRWSVECAAHNAYQRDNHVIQHPENPKARGASPGGAWAGLNSVLAEDVWTRQANPWENAPIHLLQLFSPSLSVIGLDDSRGRQCATTWPGMLRAPVTRDTIFTYPANGARGLPPSENAEESPFVPGRFVGIPQGRTAGRELFVYLNQANLIGPAQVTIVTAKLLKGHRSVRVRWVDNSTATIGPYLTGGIVIPVKPLSPNANYTASVVVRDGAGTLGSTWSFTTGRHN